MNHSIHTPSASTYIRFLISGFLEFPLTVCIDEQPILKKLTYGLFSQYIEVSAFTHTIQIIHAITKELLVERKVNLRPYSVFTYCIHPIPDSAPFNLNLYTIEETFRPCHDNQCFFRFFNLLSLDEPLSFECTQVDFTSKSINPKTSSKYFLSDCESRDFILSTSSSDTPLYTLKNFLFKPQRFYTFYLLDSIKKNTSINFLISIDGNSYLEDRNPRNSRNKNTQE